MQLEDARVPGIRRREEKQQEKEQQRPAVGYDLNQYGNQHFQEPESDIDEDARVEDAVVELAGGRVYVKTYE